MLKRINNLHLSFLVVLVSVLSIFLIQQYAFAQWEDPTSLPGGGTDTGNIVLNPMADDLQLNDFSLLGPNITIDSDGNDAVSIINNARLCLNGDCQGTWPSGGDTDWTENAPNIYRLSGYVGIGTDTPNRKLHIADYSSNAEIDIQSISGEGNHWAIYHDTNSDDLRFWKESLNTVVFSDNGYVGIGTDTPTYKLDIKALGAESGLRALAENSSAYAIFAENMTGWKSVAIRAEGHDPIEAYSDYDNFATAIK